MDTPIRHSPSWPVSDRAFAPVNASRGYPGWICKNNCDNRQVWPEDSKLRRCPTCISPLIRYSGYEEKR